MKNETRENFEGTTRLTPQTLQKLKDKGFLYVQIKGFTFDKRQDYMEPRYFVLIPIKEFSSDPNKKEIYEPINSEILIDWSNSTNEGIEVLVALNTSGY
jgi:hypothetical protein